MTNIGWYFKPQPKGFRDRNPIHGAFFDSEAVGSVVAAVVREGLQNSGDARSDKAAEDVPVRVRIFVSGDEHALPAEQASVWGQDFWAHVAAKDSGLHGAPGRGEPCRFLAFEDFTTSGLEGAVESDSPSDQPFYCFFRAENATSKSADSGGSWGVGKSAFPRASRANAFFAVSTRESDGRTVLMGSLTLRTRHVNGVKYSPDSWFGVPEPGEDGGGVIQPIEDAKIISRFCDDFTLIRPLDGDLANRTGTSIIVPWCDPELDKNSIVRAVLESNLLPIVGGAIEVAVGDDPDRSRDLILSADTVENVVAGLGDSVLLATVRLARWVREHGEAARVSAVHEPTRNAVKWDQYSLVAGDRDRLRQQFDAGKPVIVRAPVPMRKKDGGGEHTSHLEVAIQRTPDGGTIRPVFVRGTVVVPDQQIKRVPGALAIITTERDELGNLLRAAEDPGHKEWSASSDNFYMFKEEYAYAKSYLTLAREAAASAQRLLQDAESDEDFDLLGDVFSLPKPPDGEGVTAGQQRGRLRHKKKKKVIVPPPRPRLVEARKLTGGFRIVPAAGDNPTPARITVWAGYDRRKGDPIRKWDHADFEFDKAPIVIEHAGVELEESGGNVIRMQIIEPEFELSVTGFQPSRGDVVVRVRPEGRLNA